MAKKKTSAQQFAAIFALFTRGATPAERAAAERKMDAWLKRHGKTRADIQSILVQAAADDAAAQPPPPPSDPRDSDPAGPIITPLDLVHALLQDYTALDKHEYIAMALWAVHSHVYDQFQVTPRLALTSPVRGCGKSITLNVLDRLVARHELVDNITAGALYDTIDQYRPTMLIDEADNLELSAKAALRAILNAGYYKGRYIRRGVGKQARRYAVFAPVALASIGILTLPLMSRSIVIHMKRHDGSRPLRRFIEGDTQDLDIAYQHTHAWARDAVLNPNPKMPPELGADRLADNWRVLIAVADACGPAWGVLAREAAVAFARHYRDEDVVVILLAATRDVFDASGVDRLTLEAIVRALHAMEDAGWDEWRGERGDQRPHKITKAEVSRLIRDRFRVSAHSVWPPPPRRPEHRSAKGYYRADLEPLWAAYCPSAGTAAQPVLRVIGKSKE
jgi:Protein of unknown function (DUF3631)